MSVLCCVLFAYAFLQFCSAQGINCTVTQDDKQTTYSISDAAHVSGVKGSDCEYTWANASEHMLAHNEDETPELVMSNGLNTLVTSECIDTIIHRRICASEWVLDTALCSINCTENARFHKDKEISHNHIVAIIVPVLLLLVLFSFLLYKFKNEILRICSCRQMRCIYTAQKTQDTVPEAAGTRNVDADEHFV